METLLEILRPDFLLREALLASILIGLVSPLAGVYFVLRRMVFLGVALPQVSAAGIAASFFVYGLLVGQHEHRGVAEPWLAMVGSFTLTLVATLILAFFDRRGGAVEARIGTAYAIAAAATILFLAKDPHGEAEAVHLLKGDMLATTEASLTYLTVTLGVVALVFFVFRRELLLVSFDRDQAMVFGKRAGLWDLVLYLLIGAVISICVMTAGPIATFGFLIIPPVTVRMLTNRMLTFTLGSAALGAVTGFVGFWGAYSFDLPLGPAEVACASAILVVTAGGVALVRAIRTGGAR